MQCRDDDVGPEARTVFADAPTLVLEASDPGGFVELEVGKPFFDFLTWIKNREVLADYLVGGVPLEPLSTGVPAQDVAIGVESENGVVVDALDQQAMQLAGLVSDAAR